MSKDISGVGLKTIKTSNAKEIKKFLKANKVLVLVLSFMLFLALVALMFQKSYAFEGVSGVSGTCNWTIDTNGKMIIEPQQGQTECTLKNQSINTSSPWFSNRTDITSVEVKAGVKANTNASSLFYGLANATSIDVTKLDTSNVTKIDGMFHN